MSQPQRIADVLAQLLARRGYANQQSAAAFGEAWSKAVGEPMCQYTRAGNLKRGMLEVTVANSTLMQELGYQKSDILSSLSQLLPDQKIRDLRFRVGSIV
ncbi:MAG: DUF721 domain-containing protein [Planctomycetota bacterium]|nr:DUF721 domain-containing protein [Planctomycetota bacterium]